MSQSHREPLLNDRIDTMGAANCVSNAPPNSAPSKMSTSACSVATSSRFSWSNQCAV